MIIEKSKLKGEVFLFPSKSELHRALICAAFSEQNSVIKNYGECRDVTATANALKSFGADLTIVKTCANVCSKDLKNSGEEAVVFCGDSASTLRFLMPAAAVLGKKTTFILGESLAARPIDGHLNFLKEHGVNATRDGNKITLIGSLFGGRYTVDASVSSQFLSGLLMALPNAKNKSEIICKGELVSAEYVDMTLDIMRRFGVYVSREENLFKITPSRYKGANFNPYADWSAAAFYYSAAALGGEITLKGLDKNSLQPDRAAVQIFKNFGVCTTCLSDGDIKLSPTKKEEKIKIDISNTPDLFPAVCVAATRCPKTEISGVARLAYKESNRVFAMQKGLESFGVKTKISGDTFTVFGNNTNAADRTVQGCGDHRIVMAFSVLASFCDGKTEITDAPCTNKSYPEFFKHFKLLGGKCFE